MRCRVMRTIINIGGMFWNSWKRNSEPEMMFSCSIELKMLHPERLTEVFPILNEYGLGFKTLKRRMNS